MTIEDVAEAAGVSKSTVSRVVNGHTTVAPDINRRVKTAMNDIGYRIPLKRRGPKPAIPSTQCRGMVTGNIGLLILGRTRKLLEFPSSARMLAGFFTTAQKLNMRPIIIEMPDLSVMPDIIRNGDVDGLVIIGSDVTKELADLFHPTPIVWQGRLPLDLPTVDHIVVNSRAVGILAADYMLKRGATNLAWLNHDAQHSSFQLRFESFKERAEKTTGVTVRKYVTQSSGILESRMWGINQLRNDYTDLIDRMLAENGIPDGIFVPTDQQCSILHTLLKERRIIPGKDLITISCNNDVQWLSTMHPTPATIDLCIEKHGQLAVERLLKRIENPMEDPIMELVTPKLIKQKTKEA